jgi:predicted SAM-dependent methyltransferase
MSHPLQLHLGCGARYIPGFVHVDLDDFPHIDHRLSIDRLPMFEDETVDLIYCSHAFTYFDRVAALDVLKEWRRVLKPGGVLRLSVPDFAALARLYQETGQMSRIIGPLYGRMEIETSSGRQLIFHKTAYDQASLEALCREAGFRTCSAYDWRETVHRDYDDFSQAYYPHMDKEHGLQISLNMEAVR